MRKYIILLAVLPIITAFVKKPLPATPTSGVYLSAGALTVGCGVAANGHPDEVPVLSVGNGFSIQVTSGAGGPVTSTPSFSDLVIAKMFDKSSLRIQHHALKKSSNTNFEIKYYDGISSSEVYKIVLREVIVSASSSSNADCGSGCPGIAETYAFNPKTIEWHNFKTTPAQVLVYNLTTNEVSFNQ